MSFPRTSLGLVASGFQPKGISLKALILKPNGQRSNVEFGSVIVSPSNYLAAASVMIGAPGDANGGKVYIFGRPIGEKSVLTALREISSPIPNKVGAVFGNDDQFGKAIATNEILLEMN